jgi:hypothetical protein
MRQTMLWESDSVSDPDTLFDIVGKKRSKKPDLNGFMSVLVFRPVVKLPYNFLKMSSNPNFMASNGASLFSNYGGLPGDASA